MRFVILLFFVYVVIQNFDSASAVCDGDFQFIDDGMISFGIEKARASFLATRPTPFDRLDVTLLLPTNDQRMWLRGSYNQFELAYPASTVKLPYMASAVHWCTSLSLKYDCLDTHVRQMIQVSDNLETGVVVDYISGAPNYPETAETAQFQQWLAKRMYTENLLESKGLLGNQTILHKTWPTNSGSGPNGAEQVALNIYGRNQMCPACAASLMLSIAKGFWHKEATTYMLQLLNHAKWAGYTSFGFGLPPGSQIYTKIGDAYDTLEEVAYIVLPNGKELILTAYSNGLERTQPEPWDCSGLGVFAELLLDNLGLNEGNPPKYIYTVTSSNFFKTGSTWQTMANQRDQYGSSFLATPSSDAASAGWNISVPSSGLYEVTMWFPQDSAFAPDLVITIDSADGSDSAYVSQQYAGGRWRKLGDFRFNAGVTYTVSVSGKSQAGKSVAVNALKLHAWPECNGIPAAACIFGP